MSDLQPKNILIYRADDNRIRLEVKLEEKNIWLSQKQIGELYQKSKATISEHIKNIFQDGELETESTVRKFRTVQKEGDRQVERLTEHYNLDMILAVGYRVRSHVGTKFRQWATGILKEYIIKGFVLDDERLKNPQQFGDDYFDELTALKGLVEQYLVFAETQAKQKIPMRMIDWIKKLDGFLELNERNILEHAGKISHEMALDVADREYKKYCEIQKSKTNQIESDFDNVVKQLKGKKGGGGD
jgi:hypothetical protein